jgi:hypothetical protein
MEKKMRLNEQVNNTQVYNVFFKIVSSQKITDNKLSRILGVQADLISKYRRKTKNIPPSHLFTLMGLYNYWLFLIQFSENKR